VRNILKYNDFLDYVSKLLVHYKANRALWLMMAGVAVMFLPTLYGLFAVNGLWLDDEHSHGPIILSISFWLIWKRWQNVTDSKDLMPAIGLAWLCFTIAAILYIPGRALSIVYFESGAFVWALGGVILMVGGIKLLDALKFPLFFMIFMIPLPNTLVGPLTGAMKLAVSAVTVNILGWADYPVARNGVIISLGQYQLLVADACSGMRTLFMLEALGILYLNLVDYTSKLRNIVLPILIIPISFTANVVRVIVLSLITYYWGSAAGQGFLHGFAGMVLFLAGLLMMLCFDHLLRLLSVKFNGH
jgi:exosortase B